jgi:hypothetical protein
LSSSHFLEANEAETEGAALLVLHDYSAQDLAIGTKEGLKILFRGDEAFWELLHKQVV